eukprot:11146367-Karenia_brevis.AAC.1
MVWLYSCCCFVISLVFDAGIRMDQGNLQLPLPLAIALAAAGAGGGLGAWSLLAARAVTHPAVQRVVTDSVHSAGDSVAAGAQ